MHKHKRVTSLNYGIVSKKKLHYAYQMISSTTSKLNEVGEDH